MIFSKQKMERAFAYMYPYYEKILLVNANDNTYEPIKVNTEEWLIINKEMSFSDWIFWFSNSLLYKKKDESILYFTNMENLLRLKSPKVIQYEKYIGNCYHNVQLEYYPLGDGTGYLFVKDLTEMEKENKR